MLNISELSDMDAIVLHRLAPKLDKTPGIVVRFTRQTVHDKWLDCQCNLKGSDTPIHILENPSIQNKMLLWVTKQCARDKQYGYMWHRDGTLFVPRDDGGRAFLVKAMEDLSTLDEIAPIMEYHVSPSSLNNYISEEYRSSLK